MFASFYGDSDRIEIPFNPATIQFDNILFDDFNCNAIVPFIDPKSSKCAAILSRAAEKHLKPEWASADHENAKLSLYINIEDDKPDIQLIVDLVHKNFTDSEKQNMLKAANRDEGERGYTEYDDLLYKFSHIDSGKTLSEETGDLDMFPAWLTDKEMGEVMYIVAQALREDFLQQFCTKRIKTA